MNDTAERNEVAHAIKRMMDRYPDWRIGQLITNVATWARGAHPESIWDVENEEFVEVINKHLEQQTD